MLTIKEITDKKIYKDNWKKLHLHVLQSWEWGDIKSDSLPPLRLAIYEEGSIISLIYIKQISKIAGKITFGYVSKASWAEDKSSQIITALEEYLKTSKLGFLLLDLNSINNDKEVKYFGLQSVGGTTQPQWTNIIDLKKEEEVWMNMKGKYRRNIKKSKREGVSVEVFDSGQKALDNFYSVMEEIFKNTKYIMHNKSYFQKVWTNLSKDKLAEILLAKKDDKVVGAYLVAYDKKSAYELYGGVTFEGRKSEAGYLLKWEAIKRANDLKKSKYDHWGTAKKDLKGNYDKQSELYNISKFKEGFGGNYVEFEEQKAIINSNFDYTIFRLLSWLNKKKLMLAKMF